MPVETALFEYVVIPGLHLRYIRYQPSPHGRALCGKRPKYAEPGGRAASTDNTVRWCARCLRVLHECYPDQREIADG